MLSCALQGAKKVKGDLGTGWLQHSTARWANHNGVQPLHMPCQWLYRNAQRSSSRASDWCSELTNGVIVTVMRPQNSCQGTAKSRLIQMEQTGCMCMLCSQFGLESMLAARHRCFHHWPNLYTPCAGFQHKRAQ